MNIKIKRLNNTTQLPERQTDGSAGADIRADILDPITILPNETIKVPTGLSIEIPSNEYGAFIFPRSGLSTKYGIALANKVAVIDSDYRGEIQVPLHNHSDKAFIVEPQMRIAQLVIMPVVCANYVDCKELTETDRGNGGFGSTGK